MPLSFCIQLDCVQRSPQITRKVEVNNRNHFQTWVSVFSLLSLNDVIRSQWKDSQKLTRVTRIQNFSSILAVSIMLFDQCMSLLSFWNTAAGQDQLRLNAFKPHPLFLNMHGSSLIAYLWLLSCCINPTASVASGYKTESLKHDIRPHRAIAVSSFTWHITFSGLTAHFSHKMWLASSNGRLKKASNRHLHMPSFVFFAQLTA